MYENEAAHVRLGIEFLQVMTEEDYLLDPTFDVLDLERKLNEIQAETASSPICPLRPLTMMRRGNMSTRVISRIVRIWRTKWSNAKS